VSIFVAATQDGNHVKSRSNLGKIHNTKINNYFQALKNLQDSSSGVVVWWKNPVVSKGAVYPVIRRNARFARFIININNFFKYKIASASYHE
jgi:hypothetical protein